ncbi:MAG: hypothetical protein KHZ71_14795, partial [Anaerotruncus colihominis]|uniref:hypothetical protein n=1 Tax=Anaerotruncus colihominis TaxID=169435 RepID=UPI001DB2A2DC
SAKRHGIIAHQKAVAAQAASRWAQPRYNNRFAVIIPYRRISSTAFLVFLTKDQRLTQTAKAF